MKLMTASGGVVISLKSIRSSRIQIRDVLYQSMNVSSPKAISYVQKISDAIGNELQLLLPLITLEFLRTQLERGY